MHRDATEPAERERREDAPDDALLVARARDGDEDSFEELVHRHSPALLSLATRMLGDRAEAEDAVQDAFVGAWRRLPEFRGQASFRTWMYRIVTNQSLNHLRARHPATSLEAVREPAAPEHEASPERLAESNAAMRDLAEAMADLSPEQRACWVLRDLHDMSYDEIADAVGVGRQAVRGRIFRARRHLTAAMEAWR
ncbi:RNA polymerase sigma factor [Streptomyces sp. TS71-3]|uniref:RNA polymerase sigma factor n=1 Tax=Streptomyces sp. TS71-3 TaxID=2733862 RepID=UPI001B26571D|nr:sigma-70 family RNA polymerase sigma factor [Streptomyces sp. TS71-3]GHJ39188.1 DNA-directed RNA polymerase sigma-70 factor [Streptomyces sp. TS71-3]